MLSKERLQTATGPMYAHKVVVMQPIVEISLQRFHGLEDLFAERDLIVLLQERLVEPLDCRSPEVISPSFFFMSLIARGNLKSFLSTLPQYSVPQPIRIRRTGSTLSLTRSAAVISLIVL